MLNKLKLVVIKLFILFKSVVKFNIFDYYMSAVFDILLSIINYFDITPWSVYKITKYGFAV